ncbi:MAG: hypothetical protein M0P31_02855 [Solirubrobacteraceae bacterium]|nr:hypothetical protein [Solirubrobacteraceae bacterium]
MSDHRFDREAEVAKLARLLGVAEDELAFALDVPTAELAAYRDALTARLFDGSGGALKRAADASRLMPTKVLAAVAQFALGPLICARLAGIIDPERAAGIAEALKDDYLADVAVEMDPRRATAVIALIPGERIVSINRILCERREWVPMGRFVAALGDEQLRRCVDALTDEELLRIGYVMDGVERLDDIYAMLSDDRIRHAVTWSREAGVADRTAHLQRHLGPEQTARVERITAELDG